MEAGSCKGPTNAQTSWRLGGGTIPTSLLNHVQVQAQSRTIHDLTFLTRSAGMPWLRGAILPFLVASTLLPGIKVARKAWPDAQTPQHRDVKGGVQGLVLEWLAYGGNSVDRPRGPSSDAVINQDRGIRGGDR